MKAPHDGILEGARDQPALIGFADALAAPETAWSLLEAGYSVVAFARRGSRPPLRRCKAVKIVEVTSPRQDADRATSDLRELLSSRRYRAVMPLDDDAVWLCNEASRDLPGVRIAGPTGDPAELTLDKRLQLDAAARAGFRVPPTQCIETVAELLSLSDLPVVLKPARPVAEDGGALQRPKSYVCGTRRELVAAAEAWGGSQPLLAQPLLSGLGEGLFGLAGVSGLSVLSAHRRIRMMNPHGSGSSACISIPVDGEVAEAAERMLVGAQWRGMFMLEFLRAGDGTLWFMELNGRPWGSMALARRAGFEYPAWALKQLEDAAFRPVALASGNGAACRHLGRELVHLLMVLRGPKSAAAQWPSRWRTTREVLRFRRDEHWYNWRRKDPAVFVEDSVRTVVSQVLQGARR